MFLSRTVKPHSEYHNDGTTYPKIFQEFRRIRDIAKTASVVKYNLNKFVDMLYLR